MSNYLNNHGSEIKTSNLKLSFHKRAKKFELLFSEYLPKDYSSKIIDLGCSTGQIVGWLQHIGYEKASGVDSDSESISFGKEAGINNLYQNDIFEHLGKIGSESVDLFILRDITEHLVKKDFERILCLLEEKLTVNGFIWIQTPNGISPASHFMMYGDWTHETLVSPTSLRQLVSDSSSLEIKKLKGEHVVKLGLRKLHLKIIRSIINSIYKFYLSTLTSLNYSEIIIEPNLITVLKKKKN